MTHTSGIEGIICPLGIVIDTTDDGIDLLHPVLGLMCGLVHKQDVRLCTLESLCVLVVLTISEDDP